MKERVQRLASDSAPSSTFSETPAATELGSDEAIGIREVGDQAGGSVEFDGLTESNGDIPQQHGLGQHARVAEVRPGDLGVAGRQCRPEMRFGGSQVADRPGEAPDRDEHRRAERA